MPSTSIVITSTFFTFNVLSAGILVNINSVLTVNEYRFAKEDTTQKATATSKHNINRPILRRSRLLISNQEFPFCDILTFWVQLLH
ncbi:hypothetical protein D3C80_402390 [compost metagenome]